MQEQIDALAARVASLEERGTANQDAIAWLWGQNMELAALVPHPCLDHAAEFFLPQHFFKERWF